MNPQFSGLTLTPGWDTVKARRRLVERQEPVREDDEIVTCFRDGQVTLRSNRRTEGFTNAIQEHGYKAVEPGDLVVHSMDAFAGAIGVSDSRGKMSPVVGIYQVQDGDSRFYAYFLRACADAGYIQSLAKGIRERSTSFDRQSLADIDFPVIPFDEQRRIADFLDDQVGRIDQAIELRKRQVKLLNEKLKVQLDELVNGRICYVGGVESRMAWPVREFRLLFSARKESGRADLPTLGVSLATGVNVRSSDDGRPAASLDQANYKVVYPNDIVMNALGKPHGSIGRSKHLGITSPAYWVLIANSSLCNARFMHYLLRSETLISEYKRLSKFLPPSQLDLSWENFRKIATPLPPLSEQGELAASCEALETELLLAGSEVSAATSNLEERKRSLVTAAVTGQLDVTSARPLIGPWVSRAHTPFVESPAQTAGVTL